MPGQTLSKDCLLPPLTVETLVNGGAGLARYQGQVVFLPHTAVGDVVVARVVHVKKQYAEAKVVEVLEPGRSRCPPKCPVAGDCGGCQWQHLPYAEQLLWKERLFRETLIHQCHVDAASFRPIIPAPSAWHYRSRVQIKCHNTGAGFVTGFYRPRSHYVVAVDQCPIMDPRLTHLLLLLRASINGTDHARFIPQIDLFIDDFEKKSVIVHYLGRNRAALLKMLKSLRPDADLLLQCGARNSLSAIQGDGRMRIRVDTPEIVLHYAAGSFSQVNLRQNRSLVDAVMEIRRWSAADRVLELYCGMGNFSLPLARRAGHLLGIEESELSIAMAKRNSVANQISNAEFHALSADSFRQRSDLHRPFDVVFLDPPRTGAYAVLKSLISFAVPEVVYVSCNPQTLARDLTLLTHNGYRIVSSQVLDMFPQTFHCESVTLLEKRI